MLSVLRRWWHDSVNGKQSRRPARRRFYRPGLESLEDRVTPSTYFVDQNHPNASDSGPGTLDNPFLTINEGTSRALAGDTVLVNSGVYNELVTVKNSGTSSDPIIVAASEGANVTVRGQNHGFKISARSWITIRGFDITETVSYGVYLINASNITLENNDISFAGQRVSGFSAVGVKISSVVSSRIIGNVVHDNSDSGIQVTGNSTGIEVIGNTAFGNARGFTRAATGIDIRTGSNLIANNTTYNNEDTGIQIYSAADGSSVTSNNRIVNNVSYGNGDHGIDVLRSPVEYIVGNTVYNNATAGINVEGGSTNVVIANNISVDNGINSTRTRGNIRVDGPSIPGTTLDYDLVFLRPSASGQAMFVWGTTTYTSLSAFVAATGMETHGLQADPLWVAAPWGDFHLQAGSPAIDSADSGVTGQQDFDHDGKPRRDDLSTPNTGAGPRPFDDRGAFEFQPSNLPPTTTGIPDVTVDEDGPNTTVDLFAAFEDEDPDSALVFSLTAVSNAALFASTEIDNVAGTLTLAYAANAFGSSTVTVRAIDTTGLFTDTTFAVTVNPVNDVPTAGTIANVTVDEDGPSTTINLFAAFSDLEDTDSSLTYTIQSNTNPGLFSSTTINGVAGTLVLAYAANANGAATLTIRATDTGGLFAETSFSVTVNPVNDAPTSGGIGNVFVGVNAPDRVIDLFAAFEDPDDADGTLTFTIASNTNPSLFDATEIDGIAGTLRLDFAADQSGDAQITIRATDSSGASGETTFSVTVSDSNTPPTTSGIDDVTVDEDAPATIIDLFAAFDDAQDADADLTYTIEGNSNPSLFSSTPIDSPAGTLTLNYAANQHGVASLTVRATDTDGLFVETSFTVTVNSVNDVPTSTGIADVIVAANAADTAIDLFAAFADIEDADGDLTYCVQANTNAALFSSTAIDPATGTLTLDYNADQGGVARLTVRATDTGGLFAEASFTVSIGTRFWYVDKSNTSPTPNGSASNPFTTIGAAAAVAVAGDTVIVASGTYSEMITVAASGTMSQPVVFTAAPGASAIVTGQTNGFKISSKSWVTVHGFLITGTTSHGILVSSSSNITISGNEISNAGQPVSGQASRGISLNATTNSLVTGNRTHHNTDTGIFLGTGTTGVRVLRNVSHDNARVFSPAATGIDVRHGGNTLIGNFTFNNEDSGIQVSGLNGTAGAGVNLIANNVSYNNGDHGISILRSSNQQIISNSIYNNFVSGISAEGGSTGTLIFNNISVDNGLNNGNARGNIRVDATSISGSILDYNLVFLRASSLSKAMIVWGTTIYTTLSAFQAATGMEAHGIEADPLWVDPDAGNFRLRAGSAAIDSAKSDAPGQQSTDAEGNARIDDPFTADTGGGSQTFHDRGAFEFFDF